MGILFVAAVAGTGLYLALQRQAPAQGSAEAGFARDMQVHHAQAVEMALIVREKSTDPVLRAVAYDIATSQQQQMGQMYAWLEMWQLPQFGTYKAMDWMQGMDHSSMDSSSGTGDSDGMRMTLLADGRMPGMATGGDVQRLRDLSGKRAEVLFLQLMTTHHKAGVMMAAAILQATDEPAVKNLARAIRTAQAAEIKTMQDMLAQRGATPSTEAG